MAINPFAQFVVEEEEETSEVNPFAQSAENPFAQFAVSTPEPVAPEAPAPPITEPFDAEAVEPEVPAEKPDYNIARGMGERGATLLGNLVQLPEKVGDLLAEGSESFLGGGFAVMPGEPLSDEMPGWRWLGPKEYKAMQENPESTFLLNEYGKDLKGADLGYEQHQGWDEGKKKLFDEELSWGDRASGIGNIMSWGFETGAVSLPDMVGVLVAAPAYLASRTNEIAEERAQADGREEVTEEDLAVGGLTAAAVSVLERFGAQRLLSFAKEGGGIINGVLKGGAVEGLTETQQELIEYLGTQVGTEKGVTFLEGLERTLQGLVGGVSFGAPAGGVSGAAGYVLPDEKAAIDATADPDATSVDETADAVIESTQTDFEDEFSAPAQPELQGPDITREPAPAEMDLELDETAAQEMGLLDEPAPEPAVEPAPVLQPDTEVVPESDETVQAQVAVMDSPDTDRKAVYLPDGTQAAQIELDETKHNLTELPNGAAVVTPVGAEGNRTAIGLINAITTGNEQLKQQAIADATNIGGVGKLVGAPVVTVRGPDGVVVQSASVDPAGEVETKANQLAEQIGGTVETTAADAVIEERVTDLEAGLDEQYKPELNFVEPETRVPMASVTEAKNRYQTIVDQHRAIYEGPGAKGRGRKRSSNIKQKALADQAWIALVEMLDVMKAEGVDTSGLKALLKSVSKMEPTMDMTEKQLKNNRDTKPISGRFKSKGNPPGGWTKTIEDFYVGVNRELQRLEQEGPTLVPGMETKQATTYDTTNRPKRTAEEKARKGDIEDYYEGQRELDAAARAEAVTPSVEEVVEAEEAVAPEVVEIEGIVEEELPADQLNTPEEQAEILAARERAKQAGVTVGEQLRAEQRKREQAAAAKEEARIKAAAEKAKKAKPVVTKKKKRRTKAEIEAAKKADEKARLEKLEQGSKDLAAAMKPKPKPKAEPVVEQEQPIPPELLEVQEREAEVDAEMLNDEAAQWLRDNLDATKSREKSLTGNPDKTAIILGREKSSATMDEGLDTGGTMTAAGLLNTIYEKLSETDPYRMLIEKMQSVGVGDITVRKVSDREMSDVAGPNTNGIFRTAVDGTREIWLNEKVFGDAFATKVAMHEMVHAMTTEALRTNNPTAMKLERLRKRVIRELEAEGGEFAAQDYGFTNVDEFVAEAFTNPEFQKLLASIQTGKGPGENLWAKFVEIIQDFLGVPVDSQAALAEVLTLGGDLFMNPTQVAEAQRDPAGYISQEADFDRPPSADEIAMMMMGDRTDRILADRSVRKTVQTVGNFIVGRGATPIDTIKDSSPAIRLGLSTMDQIIRNHARKFRKGSKNLLKDLQKIMREKTRIARELQQKAGKIDRLWRDLERQKGGYDISERLSKLMRDSTLNDVNPDLAFYNIENKHLWKGKSDQVVRKNRARHEAAKAEFDALPARARSVYRQVREFYKNQRIEMRRATVEKIAVANKLEDQLSPADYQTILNATEPADIKNVDFSPMGDMADDIKQSIDTVLFATEVKGPYFPLRRFGDNAVDAVRKTVSQPFADRKAALASSKALKASHPLDKIKTSKVDGTWRVVREERIFETYETKREAAARAKNLTDQGFSNRTTGGAVVNTKMSPNQHTEGSGAGRLLQQAKGKLGEGTPEFRALETAFTEMLLANSIQKAELKRNRVKGASLNMRRGFAERAFAGSWALADVKTSFEQAEAMNALEKFARTEAKDKVAAGEVYNEIYRRTETELSERATSKLDSVLSKVGFVWYLMSPSYTVINMSQPLLVAGPYLAGKYGKSGTAELFKAYKDVSKVAAKELWKVKAGWTGGPENMLDLVLADTKGTPVGDMIKVLTDQGIIDATFMQELYESSQGKDDRALGGRVVNKTMDIARTMPQIAEVVNRVVVAKAAFNSEMNRNGGDTEAATEAAGEAILQTQFDYSTQNKPRYFKGPPGVKSVMMFKMYAQGMYALMASNWVKTFRNERPGDRAEGIKTLAYLHGAHTVAAGALGGLLIEPIRAILWAMNELRFAEDDEDWDINAEVEMFLKDMFGDFAGEILTRGVPAGLGIGGGERVSMEHMLMMGLNDTKSMQDGWVELLMKIGGPIVATGSSIARGMDYMAQGETLKGVESMLPKGFRDAIRGAIRYPMEGPTNWSGAALPVELSTFDMAQQFFGITPAPMTRYYEQMGAIDRRKKKVDAEKKRLIQAWSRSDNDVEFEMQYIMPFNLRNDPNDEITWDHLERKRTGREDKEDELRFGADDMTDVEMQMRSRLGM